MRARRRRRPHHQPQVGLVFYGRRRYTHVQLPFLFANRRRTDAAGRWTGVLDEARRGGPSSSRSRRSGAPPPAPPATAQLTFSPQPAARRLSPAGRLHRQHGRPRGSRVHPQGRGAERQRRLPEARGAQGAALAVPSVCSRCRIVACCCFQHPSSLARLSSEDLARPQDVAGRKAQIAENNAGYCSFYSSLTGPGSISNSSRHTLYLKIGALRSPPLPACSEHPPLARSSDVRCLRPQKGCCGCCSAPPLPTTTSGRGPRLLSSRP